MYHESRRSVPVAAASSVRLGCSVGEAAVYQCLVVPEARRANAATADRRRPMAGHPGALGNGIYGNQLGGVSGNSRSLTRQRYRSMGSRWVWGPGSSRISTGVRKLSGWRRPA